MNQKLVKKLESERMRRIRQASESLLEGNTGEAKQNLEWIATAAKIIEDNQKKPDKFVVHRIAIILLIVCVVVGEAAQGECGARCGSKFGNHAIDGRMEAGCFFCVSDSARQCSYAANIVVRC